MQINTLALQNTDSKNNNITNNNKKTVNVFSDIYKSFLFNCV